MSKQAGWREPVEGVGFGAGCHVAGSCGDGTLLSKAAVASLHWRGTAKLCKISLDEFLILWTDGLALVEVCFQLYGPLCLDVNHSHIYWKNSILQVQVI